MSKAGKKHSYKSGRRKQTGWPRLLKTVPWFAWLSLGIIAAAILCFTLIPMTGESGDSSRSGELRAAIIDQLHGLYPNEGLTAELTTELEDHGFTVDIYRDDDVTVDLYEELADYGYRLIILRTHSGILSHETDAGREATPATCIFTNEEYSRFKHIPEQLNGELAKARIGPGYPIVFGIGARFVDHSMRSDFNGAVIILMGCNGLYVNDLARSFYDRGTSLYLAWDDLVGLDYVDTAGLELLGNMLAGDTSIGDSVKKTMETTGPDPDFGAAIKYYPLTSGDRTFWELIK